jgi:hypothetical protein
MQHPAFDHDKKRWDKFKAFANGHDRYGHRYGWSDNAAFYQLETGEVFTPWLSFAKDKRGLYKDLNIAVLATADDDCPSLYTPDGTKVPKAWLNHGGGQQVVIDYDTKRVVGLNWCNGRNVTRAGVDGVKTGIPVWLRTHAVVYFAGAGEPPVGGMLRTTFPRVWTPEETAHLDGLRSGARAWHTLTEQTKTYSDHRALDPLRYLTKSLADLSTSERIAVIYDGWAKRFTTTYHPYLVIK